ncbi:segregation/condensation protein A [Candidatus Mycoplasma pogonae]
MKNLDINIANFTGPLDLLLALVKEKKMNIFEVNLMEVANEYIRIMQEVKNSNLELASDYLLMTATLLQIQAKMLLERPEEEVINPEKEILLKQLAEYQEFKKVADFLRKQEIEREKIFIKKASNYDDYQLEIDRNFINSHSTLETFLKIMRQLIEKIKVNKLHTINVQSVNITPEEQRKYIYELFINKEFLDLKSIDNLPTISHFVITLIALLDMARKEEILLTQDYQFSEIKILKGPKYGRN